MKYTIYTDGSSIGNPGNGGYGYIIIVEDRMYQFAGYEKDATNNQMELKAMIEALKNVPEGSSVTLFSDSDYCIRGITQWIGMWKRNGWISTSGKSVANQFLWEDLINLSITRHVEYIWTKSHCGSMLNTLVDSLAHNAAKHQAKQQLETNLFELINNYVIKSQPQNKSKQPEKRTSKNRSFKGGRI